MLPYFQVSVSVLLLRTDPVARNGCPVLQYVRKSQQFTATSQSMYHNLKLFGARGHKSDISEAAGLSPC